MMASAVKKRDSRTRGINPSVRDIRQLAGPKAGKAALMWLSAVADTFLFISILVFILVFVLVFIFAGVFDIRLHALRRVRRHRLTKILKRFGPPPAS
jgi:hypothetical protein